jgi:hypothetical protein
MFLAPTGLAFAQDSGFLRGRGKLDFSINVGQDSYDRFWIGSEPIEDAPFGRVDRNTVNLNIAYGLRDNIDITAGVSYVSVSTDAIFDREQDIQDFYAQLKWRFFSKDYANGRLNLLAEPGFKSPTSHYQDDNVNAIGDGQFDIRLRGVAQYLFNNGAYLALETGYDFRLDVTPDEIPVHISGGFTINRLTLTGFYTNISCTSGYDIMEGPFPGLEDEYERTGVGVYCRVTDYFGITASGWTTLDGRNTGDVDGFSLGMVLRY